MNLSQNQNRLLALNNTTVHFRKILLIVLVIAFALAGCAKRASSPLPGPMEAWERAQRYMERERYTRAQEILRDIVLNYSGSAIIDSAQFYLGVATYRLEDYVVAAEEFNRVVDQYPFSSLCGDAIYYRALCYFQQSPAYPLDQTYTDQAIQGFQRFLEDYPGHALTDSSYRYLALCRDKLGKKVYSAARVYYDLGEYASAILYADIVLDNYYDTSVAGSAQFLKSRSYFAVKDWERARRELELYLEKYPAGRFTVRTQQMLSEIARNLSKSTPVATAP